MSLSPGLGTKLRRATTTRAQSYREKAQDIFYLDFKRGGPEFIRKSGLFSPSYYTQSNPDVLLSGLDPLVHYMRVGESLGRAPHPLFDLAWYAGRGGRPDPEYSSYLVDYLTRAEAFGLSPHPLFDAKYYLERRSDVVKSNLNPLVHFVNYGSKEDARPNPVFDTDWYRRTYLSPGEALDPLSHFVLIGERLGYRPSPCFDPAFYKAQSTDLRSVDATTHFLFFGRDEGRPAYDRQAVAVRSRVAVVAHVFFAEIWPELQEKLSHIEIDYDLFLTAPQENQKLLELLRRDYPRAKVVPVANAGRDILPLLTLLPELVEKNYAAVCKIHTKKGITEAATWRKILLDGVIPSGQLFVDILNCFVEDQNLVLAGSAELNLDGKIFIGDNETNIRQASDAIGLSYRPDLHWGFIAGSMFWFKPSFFSKLSDKNLLAKFELEGKIRQDGLIAHAIERLFGYMTAAAGKRILLVDTAGRGCGGPIEMVAAPGVAMRHELADYLPERAAEARRLNPGAAAAAAAPAPTAPAPKAPVAKASAPKAPDGTRPGLNFIGPTQAVHGLGVSARGYIRAAAAAGTSLNVIPWTIGFERVAKIATDHARGPVQDINVVQLNLDFMVGAKLLDQDPLQSMMRAGWYNVCIPYWELNAIPEDWIGTLARFDEIWVASSFTHRAISAVTRTPVHVVRPAAPAPRRAVAASRPRFGIPEDRFVFFYSADAGSIPSRKNPVGYWQAYAKEFQPGEGACCVLKLGYADPQGALVAELRRMASGRPDMILVLETLPEDEMAALFSTADCYVSPHRSEGLGLTVIEAMQAGKPVIATRYGGVTDLVTSETALVIDHRLREVGEGSDPYPPHYVWADPCEGSLRRRLRQIFQEPELRSVLARKGRQAAEALFGLEATGRGLHTQIERIHAARRVDAARRVA